ELVQDPRDVIGMIADSKPLLDDLGHPRAGPEIGVEARLPGSAEQHPLELLQVLKRQPRLRPEMRTSRERRFPSFAPGPLPSLHARQRSTAGCCHIHVSMA